jgi:hypothetical protein
VSKFHFYRRGVGGGVLLAGFKSWAIVSLHLKAIFMLVCLKRLVIFLICGDMYVNVVHLMSCLEVVGVSVELVFAVFCVLGWLWWGYQLG